MNETILQKLESGEDVTADDVLQIQGETALAAYQAEAKRREQIRAEEKEAAARAEHRLQKMIFLDREAEAATRQLESLAREFDDFCLAFGRKYLETRNRIASAQMSFGREVKAAIPNVDKLKSHYAPEIESELKHLLKTLSEMGAPLSSIRSEIWQPHLLHAPVFCQTSGGYQFPATPFGALLAQIERIISTLPEPPTPEDEAKARKEAEEMTKLKLWAFAQAEAARAEVRADYGDVEPKKVA